MTVERVSGNRVAFNTVCRLAAQPPTPLLDSQVCCDALSQPLTCAAMQEFQGPNGDCYLNIDVPLSGRMAEDCLHVRRERG